MLAFPIWVSSAGLSLCATVPDDVSLGENAGDVTSALAGPSGVVVTFSTEVVDEGMAEEGAGVPVLTSMIDLVALVTLSYGVVGDELGFEGAWVKPLAVVFSSDVFVRFRTWVIEDDLVGELSFLLVVALVLPEGCVTGRLEFGLDVL